MVHNFDQVSDLLVLGRLHEPLSEVALDGNVQHFLLLASQTSHLNLLLHLEELFVSQKHHLAEFIGAKEERGVAELFGQRHFHEFHGWNQSQGLSWHSHQQWLGEKAQTLLEKGLLTAPV